MASEKTDKKKRIVYLSAQERADLRKVYEGAGWVVSFHRGYMRVKKLGWEDIIPYEKIRRFQDAVRTKRP